MTAHASLSGSLPAVAEQRSFAPALALRYAAFGLCALLLVPFTGSCAWLPAWLGLSNLCLAHAYALNRVSVFGKRSDGTMAPLCLLVLLPYLLLVWGFFWLKLLGLRREPCYVRAAPGLYLGRRPRRFELPQDCDMVVDLTAEFIEPRDVVTACQYRCLPMLNRHVSSEADLALLLRELLAFDGAIYVHCGAGRGRSAMLVAALLVLQGQADDVEAAERQLKAQRPGVQLHAAQKALIVRLTGALARLAVAPQSHSQSATTMCA
jgi:protein-tyrosine phosphatase